MFGLLQGLLIGAVFSVGVLSGTYVGTKWLAPKSSFKVIEVSYKLPDGEIVKGQAFLKGKETYYSANFVNEWLRCKVGIIKRLKNV